MREWMASCAAELESTSRLAHPLERFNDDDTYLHALLKYHHIPTPLTSPTLVNYRVADTAIVA